MTSMLAMDPIGDPKPPMLEPRVKASAYLENLPTKMVDGTLLMTWAGQDGCPVSAHFSADQAVDQGHDKRNLLDVADEDEEEGEGQQKGVVNVEQDLSS